MNEDTHDVEEALEVGRAVIFHAAPRQSEGARVRTFIRGWQRGSYIMLDIAAGQHIPLLRTGQECVLRFVALGKAYGFGAKVKDIGVGVFDTCLRVEWPTAVSAVRIRQEERVSVHVPCKIVSEFAGEAAGELQDISPAGCRVASPLQEQKGSAVQLSFVLPDGTLADKVHAQVQNVSSYPNGAFLGCKFEFEDNTVSQELHLYVLATLDRMRGERPSTPRIVIIDKNVDGIAELRSVLKENGYDVAVATDLVDGFFLLRLTRPGVLLVNAGPLPDLTGVDLCRIVKGKERFKEMPVFLYGAGADPGKAEQAGAESYFPSLDALGKVMRAITDVFPPPAPPESEDVVEDAGSPEGTPHSEAPVTGH